MQTEASDEESVVNIVMDFYFNLTTTAVLVQIGVYRL